MLNRHFGRAAYVVGAALILIPMFDAGTSVLPLRFAESRWRYGTIGLLSNSLLIPLAGVVVVFAVALAQGHRRTLRALGAVAALASVLCLAAIVTFALDAIQSQREIAPAMRGLPFIVASGTAAVKLVIGALAFGFFAFAGLQRVPGEVASAANREKVFVGGLGKRGKHEKATV